MGRVTESQQIEAENEAAALGHLEEALRGLVDPRRRQGVRYPLRTVVVVALMAMVCGCDDAEAMELWGEVNEEWLSEVLEMPHGSPSQDVFLSVFGGLEPKKFSEVFQSWAQLMSLRLGVESRHIAVDGKTSRRSADRTSGKPAIHTVSAWMCGAGLVLAQQQTREKSNEITVIPELLRVLDLRGATVTIDAMGCQTAIADMIVAGGGEYLLAVKDNQAALHDEIRRTFADAGDARPQALDEEELPAVDEHEETEKSHGRLETRRVRVMTALGHVHSSKRWTKLGYVVEVRRERTVLSTSKTSVELSHYIGSGAPKAASKVASRIRGHWGIENELHWVLDMAFGEDQARHRARNVAANLTTLRHFALSVVKQDKTRKVGVSNSRKRAGFDRKYLIRLIQGQPG
jgi:predicted transposase YbfD/YdcC